ncbi:MAG: hypothetical protein ACQCXQ_09780 [Verrucomicrobiales bacterium]|nr:hypothetical protein [Verrucomicrobiota bacterium JB025]
MNLHHPSNPTSRGLTLLEMSMVILVLLTLIQIGLFTSGKMSEWSKGRQASETLREVYSAQRMFLADHPTTDVSAITDANLLPYLQGSPDALPTVESLDGTELNILVNVSPPIINAGSGVAYDPSGDNSDSLWDVGD